MSRRRLGTLMSGSLILCGISCSNKNAAQDRSTIPSDSDDAPRASEKKMTMEAFADESPDAAAEAWRNAVNKPPANWSGYVFTLSHDYPPQQPQPPAGGYPWEVFDFKTQPAEYIQAVLNYARKDLEAIDWDPTKMEKPTWFHAPWMAEGTPSGNGREFIRGMTKERSSRVGELSPEQTNNYIANYAVGLYNDVGGWTFGRVWAVPGKPDLSGDKAIFKNGAMAIKLLFSAADPDVPGDGVPYLRNSKEWQANIAPYQSSDRVPKTLRLLQVDIAVRDKRNDSLTGWLFGTFVYNGNKPGETPFDRLAPVGLMWGDSPGITPTDVKNGQKPSQQWINADVGTYQHLGWATRINGPVDNPASSCISCHGGGAESPALTSMLPPKGGADSTILKWFVNIKAGVAKDADKGATSLDYSLQMSVAMQNWTRWDQANNPQPAVLESLRKEHPVNRGEEPRE